MKYLILLLLTMGMVLAVPGIPSDFYGSATVNGEPIQPGTVVYAYVDGVQYGMYEVDTQGQYGLLSVRGDDPDTPAKDGAREGDIVVFQIFGQEVGTAEWHQAESQEVALAVTVDTRERSGSRDSRDEASDTDALNDTENTTDGTIGVVDDDTSSEIVVPEQITDEEQITEEEQDTDADQAPPDATSEDVAEEPSNILKNLTVPILLLIIAVIIYVKKRGNRHVK